MISANKIRMQNNILADLDAQPKPVILSRSNYDFMSNFLSPRRFPDYVKRHGDVDA